MAKFEVDIAGNTRQFQASVEDAARELGQFADVLEDVADESKRVEDRTGEAMDAAGDGAKDASRNVGDLVRDTSRLEQAFRDAGRRAGDLGDDADRAADKARRGFGRAEDSLGEFRDEAGQTARETAASFGSVEDAIDGVQELAAQGLGSFGPAGAAAGLAVAGGIGLAVTAFEQLQEAEEESRQRAAEWAQAYIDAGASVLDSQQRVAMLSEIVTDPERWQEAKDNAEEWGISLSTTLRAMTGDVEALDEAEASLAEREREAADAALRQADGGQALADVLVGQTRSALDGREALDRLRQEMGDGQAAAEAYNEAVIDYARSVDDATTSVDALGNQVISLPDGTTITIDADTGQATTAVADIEHDVRTLPDGHVNVYADTSSADRALHRWANTALSKAVVVTPYLRNGERLPI